MTTTRDKETVQPPQPPESGNNVGVLRRNAGRIALVGALVVGGIGFGLSQRGGSESAPTTTPVTTSAPESTSSTTGPDTTSPETTTPEGFILPPEVESNSSLNDFEKQIFSLLANGGEPFGKEWSPYPYQYQEVDFQTLSALESGTEYTEEDVVANPELFGPIEDMLRGVCSNFYATVNMRDSEFLHEMFTDRLKNNGSLNEALSSTLSIEEVSFYRMSDIVPRNLVITGLTTPGQGDITSVDFLCVADTVQRDGELTYDMTKDFIEVGDYGSIYGRASRLSIDIDTELGKITEFTYDLSV